MKTETLDSGAPAISADALAPAPDSDGGPGARRRFATSFLSLVAVPAALLGVFAVVQLRYLMEPHPSDQIFYFQRAWELPDATIFEHKTLRIGLLIPVRIAQEIWGYSEGAYLAVPLLAGATMVVATYFLGKMLFNSVVGAAAAVILLVSPVFLTESSHLLPDLPAAALVTLSLVLVLEAARRAERDGTGDPPVWLLAVAGALFGWAYLTREFTVFLGPVVLYVFWTYGLRWRRLLAFALPAALAFVGEVVLNAVLYGKPLARITASGGHTAGARLEDQDRLDLFLELPTLLRRFRSGEVLAALLLLLALGFLVRSRSLRIAAVWVAAFWIPLTLMSGFVADPALRWLRIEKLRYWAPVFPAVAVGGVGLLHGLFQSYLGSNGRTDLIRRYGASVAVGAMVVVVVSVSIQDIDDGPQFRTNGAFQLARIRSTLAAKGADFDTIYTDSHTRLVLPLYTSTRDGDRIWDGEIKSFYEYRSPHGTVIQYTPEEVLNRPGTAVLLYRKSLLRTPGGIGRLPRYLSSPDLESDKWERRRRGQITVLWRG